MYAVVVRVDVDPATATTASTDCTLAGGETGTGARNDASMTTNGLTTTGTACADFPILAITKTLFGSPVENGDGTTTIRYDVTVSNRGGGPGTYDLDDQLRFGTGVSIVSATVANTTPGTITPLRHLERRLQPAGRHGPGHRGPDRSSVPSCSMSTGSPRG